MEDQLKTATMEHTKIFLFLLSVFATAIIYGNIFQLSPKKNYETT